MLFPEIIGHSAAPPDFVRVAWVAIWRLKRYATELFTGLHQVVLFFPCHFERQFDHGWSPHGCVSINYAGEEPKGKREGAPAR